MSTTLTETAEATVLTAVPEQPTSAAPSPSSTTSKAKAKTPKAKAPKAKAAPVPVPTLPDAYTRRDRAKLRLHAATGVPMNLLLDSSAVIEVRWRPLSQTLEVRYASGSRYRYIGVSTAIVRGLLAAPSKGSYINEHVKTLPYQQLG